MPIKIKNYASLGSTILKNPKQSYCMKFCPSCFSADYIWGVSSLLHKPDPYLLLCFALCHLLACFHMSPFQLCITLMLFSAYLCRCCSDRLRTFSSLELPVTREVVRGEYLTLSQRKQAIINTFFLEVPRSQRLFHHSEGPHTSTFHWQHATVAFSWCKHQYLRVMFTQVAYRCVMLFLHHCLNSKHQTASFPVSRHAKFESKLNKS